MSLEPWTSAVKLTSSGKCSKGRIAQGERYLKATKLPQRHMERGEHLGECLCEHFISLFFGGGGGGYVTLVQLVGNILSFCLHPLSLHPQNLETMTNINASCANFGFSGETILHISCPSINK